MSHHPDRGLDAVVLHAQSTLYERKGRTDFAQTFADEAHNDALALGYHEGRGGETTPPAAFANTPLHDAWLKGANIALEDAQVQATTSA